MQKTELLDAAGNVIPTDLCYCGRPKLASSERCCSGCLSDAMGEREGSRHLTGCNMRCATMGVPGFGVQTSAVRISEEDGQPRTMRVEGRGEYRVIRR